MFAYRPAYSIVDPYACTPQHAAVGRATLTIVVTTRLASPFWLHRDHSALQWITLATHAAAVIYCDFHFSDHAAAVADVVSMLADDWRGFTSVHCGSVIGRTHIQTCFKQHAQSAARKGAPEAVGKNGV